MAKRSLAAWLRHLETIHPKEIDLGLDRVAEVADRLGLRTSPPSTITIAGTNGKGSCVAMLVAALRAKGLSVGSYTSPHLIHYNERIALEGEPVDDALIVTAFEQIEVARGDITLSYFEFSTLAALLIFAERRVDWQVLEVGLGGRLDAVNIIDPELAIVTSIGLDHQDWLGDTRELIAREKGGIARAGKPCVVAEVDLPSTLIPAIESYRASAVVINEDWFINNTDLTLPSGHKVAMPSPDGLLPQNIGAVMVALDQLGLELDDTVLSALQNVRLPGRRQRIELGGREIILDVSHNRESVQALADLLQTRPISGKTFALFAVMADKPIRDMLSALETQVDTWYLPNIPDLPRAAGNNSVAAVMSADSVVLTPAIADAWSELNEVALPGDRILILGSFVTVGAVLELIENTAASEATQ